MWPRTQEERNRARNCGFVAFQRRADAAEARRELDGTMMGGMQLRLGWSKAVRNIKALQPLFAKSRARRLAQQQARERAREHVPALFVVAPASKRARK